LCQFQSRALPLARMKPEGTFEALGAPFARPPQVEAGDSEEEEGKVAGAVDGFADGTRGAAERELAVPVFHRVEEVTEAGGDGARTAPV